MTAMGYDAPGGPDVFRPETMPTPQPGTGQVLIRVAYAGVNRPDVIQRQGFYPPPPSASPIPGLEVSGTVVAIGKGAPPEMLNQQVCALVSGGGYAEYCLADVRHCLHVPGDLPLDQAAALPETLFTVWHNVFERGWAKEGETLLVHGGTSGIGTMAIMLGKAFGLTVIATAGSADKCQACRDLGADLAIDYKAQDFVEEVKSFTEGRGVQVVLDMVSGDYVARNLACLAEDGRHVTIAVLGGLKAGCVVSPLFSAFGPEPIRARLEGMDLSLSSQQDLLQQAWQQLSNEPELNYVFSAARFSFPVQRALITTARGVAAFDPASIGKRSQDLVPTFHDAGQFYWGRTDAWLGNKPVFGDNSKMLVLPDHLVQDIDTAADWQRAMCGISKTRG